MMAAESPALTVFASSSLDHISSAPVTGDNENEPAPVTTSKFNHGWRRVIRNFSPSWFSTTMGTGIVAVLLMTLPFLSHWATYISYIFFGLNTILFTSALTASTLRYSLYPEIWRVMLADTHNSLFLGCVPMGFATLVKCWLFSFGRYCGIWAVYVAWGGWFIDAVVAAAATVFLIFTHISQSPSPANSGLETLTATALLPISATIVVASTGVEAAEFLTEAGKGSEALGTVLTCFVMWGMGVPLAMAVLVMYYQRLAVHKLPPREVLVSCFLPLGPLGFGGHSIMYLGKVCRMLLPKMGKLAPVAGEVIYVQGFLVALVMWGFGLVWATFAVASFWRLRPIPFNMGWWGFTFPLGVYAASTVQIGNELPSAFFKILGTIFTVAVVLLWMVVAVGTIRGAWNGKLFNAPCLKNLTHEELERGIIVVSEKMT